MQLGATSNVTINTRAQSAIRNSLFSDQGLGVNITMSYEHKKCRDCRFPLICLAKANTNGTIRNELVCPMCHKVTEILSFFKDYSMSGVCNLVEKYTVRCAHCNTRIPTRGPGSLTAWLKLVKEGEKGVEAQDGKTGRLLSKIH